MQIHLAALGCRLNEAELETWGRLFSTEGHMITDNSENADLIVLNTCAVTGEAARKSRQVIHRLHRGNPEAKLVVSGCYASLAPEKVAAELGVDLVVPNAEKDQLVQRSLMTLDLPTASAAATSPDSASVFQRNRQRAFIKIQDGCRYRCTFCIVTVARGAEKSRSPEDIINEINDLNSQGVNECVLTGVHVGGYGSDLDLDLQQLVELILRNTQIPRIRFASVEPWDLPDDFWQLFKNPRLMPHMHLPLQSGADSVLRRMARRCKTDDFSSLIKKARESVPNFNITTDIIVGFPGETEDEWQSSYDFIEKTGFGHIHIFSYSPREGTKASRLPGQQTNATKSQRSKILHTLAKKLRIDAMQELLNTQQTILWEFQKDQYWYGYTPNYLRVKCRNLPDEMMAGAISDITITAIDHDSATLIADGLAIKASH